MENQPWMKMCLLLEKDDFLHCQVSFRGVTDVVFFCLYVGIVTIFLCIFV